MLTKLRISKKNMRKLKGRSTNVDYDGAGDGIRTRDALLGGQALFR